MEQTHHLTEQGYKKYQEKLNYLKTTRRSQVAERIRQAKEFGDISENAEYEAAKSEQAFVEGEITELEKLLRNAQIITPTEGDIDEVSLGTRVTLQNANTKETLEFDIVGTNETDPFNGRISNDSPVGAAVIGKKKGTTVSVKTPSGEIKYKIKKIAPSIVA